MMLKNECKCKSCVEINDVDNKWKTWEPQTPLESVLKNVLDKRL